MASGMSKENDAPPEEYSIYLRGYVAREKKPLEGAFDHEAEELDKVPPSDWSLTFDCETTIDAAQALRFGAYQLRKDGKLTKNGRGLFYAEDLSQSDLEV